MHRTILLYVAVPAVALALCACGRKNGESKTVIVETIDESTYAESRGEVDVWGRPEIEVETSGVAESDTQPSATAEPEVEEVPAGEETPIARGRIKVRNIGRLAEVFNDSNHTQLPYARQLGIAPMASLRDYYRQRRPIVKVETCSAYKIDTLTHSYPYLVPEAAALLRDIGRNFQDSLARRRGGRHRIIVTSLLRSEHSVKRLRRVNVNATEQSTHQYGTTFDITYTRFDCLDPKGMVDEGDLKNLLGEVLADLRRQNRCLVKFERKTPCFHITVTR